MKIINISSDEDNDLIYKKAFEEFGADELRLFSEGNHSSSYSLSRAFFDYCENEGDEPCLIIFDSHPGLGEGGWLRKLIEDGFPIHNILFVGLRNVDPLEKKFIGEKFRRVSIDELMFSLAEKTDAIMEFGYGKKVYLLLDFDVIDPAYVPGVECGEPGGLSSREFLYVLRRMSKMKNLKAVDLVGMNLENDINEMTSKLVSNIKEVFS